MVLIVVSSVFSALRFFGNNLQTLPGLPDVDDKSAVNEKDEGLHGTPLKREGKKAKSMNDGRPKPTQRDLAGNCLNYAACLYLSRTRLHHDTDDQYDLDSLNKTPEPTWPDGEAKEFPSSIER